MATSDVPPAYNELADSHHTINAGTARIISFCHCHTGVVDEHGRIYVGKRIRTLRDAITLPLDTSYDDVIVIMTRRVKERFSEVDLDRGEWMIAVAIIVDKEDTILSDDESWRAGRRLAEKGEGRLIFYFAKPPKNFEARKSSRICVVQ